MGCRRLGETVEVGIGIMNWKENRNVWLFTEIETR